MEIIIEEPDILEKAVSYLRIETQVKYPCQNTTNGLNVWSSGMFSRLIKDAARCNRFNSDVIYNIDTLKEAFEKFNPDIDFKPQYIGFRKDGVDGNHFITDKLKQGMRICNEYFSFYSVKLEHEEDNFYNVVFTEYSI